MAGWRRVCLSCPVRQTDSQPLTVGLVDRSAERQENDMERRWYQNMQRSTRIESPQAMLRRARYCYGKFSVCLSVCPSVRLSVCNVGGTVLT